MGYFRPKMLVYTGLGIEEAACRGTGLWCLYVCAGQYDGEDGEDEGWEERGDRRRKAIAGLKALGLDEAALHVQVGIDFLAAFESRELAEEAFHIFNEGELYSQEYAALISPVKGVVDENT